jgi:hypothetical protein
MSDITYNQLRKEISGELSPRINDFGSTVADIGRNFRNLGFETAVWLPEKIHTVNLGGIEAESYIGYSRMEGRWGLRLRTIERDHETGSFVGQRVQTLESCGNVETVMSALEKVRDLVVLIHKKAKKQAEILDQISPEIESYRNPDFHF